MKVIKDGWPAILAGLRELENARVHVGWFDEDSATVAFINDRGGNRGDNPPPRPVIGPGLDNARMAIDAAMARSVSDVLRGRGAGAAAERVGAIAEQAVRDAIVDVAPPNAPSTIAGKFGYTAPLRGFSPDRIWNKLEHRVLTAAETAGDEDAPA